LSIVICMNTKQAKRLRKAIREKYPNMDQSVRDRIYSEAKEQFAHLTSKERGGLVMIKTQGGLDVGSE
jgi:type I site-specific restriction endonuclease